MEIEVRLREGAQFDLCTGGGELRTGRSCFIVGRTHVVGIIGPSICDSEF